MHIIFYTAPTHLSAIISSSSGCLHQNLLKTYSNSLGHSEPTYVQNFTDFGYILWNNQQMQLYAVNFIPLLGSLYMFRVFYTHHQEYNL